MKEGVEMKRMADHFNIEAESHDEFFIDKLGLSEFYDEIEQQINNTNKKRNILVLGCGSGLEIERIKFKANVTAIDIAEEMIKKLKEKKLHDDVLLKTQCGSFLDIDFGNQNYDLVLSCYAMHHFNEEQKIKLYTKIFNSLTTDGVFLNGDSMAKDHEEESIRFEEARKIYDEQNLPFASLHIDVHFCIEHELEVLMKSGFDEIIIEREWTKTKLYRAIKR